MAISSVNVIPPAPDSGRRKPAVKNNRPLEIYAYSQKRTVKDAAFNNYADTFNYSK